MATTAVSAAASMVKGLPKKQKSYQVFINFRGVELRKTFISHLVDALKNDKIKYYIDADEVRSQDINILFKRIEESDIALAVFSERYSESKWCLNELVKIMQRAKEEQLKVIPIFYNVKVSDVKKEEGKFGENLRRTRSEEKNPIMLEWRKALKSVSKKMALISAELSSDSELIGEIIKSIKDVIRLIDEEDRTNMISTNICSPCLSGNASPRDIIHPEVVLPGQLCLEHMKEKMDFDSKETRIVGIVGMPGIGKTTLAKMHFDKCNGKLAFNKIFQGIRKKSKHHEWLENKLRDELVKDENSDSRIFVVLDDVDDKKQLEFLWTNPKVIKEGSKIVITTRDKASIEGLAHDTYMVPALNDKEALKLFTHHAFNDQVSQSFTWMSKKFVDYAGGNPRALEELGKELCGKDVAYWEARLETLPHVCNDNMRRELRISYDKLNEQQKDAFLDIACFFRSEEEDYVKIMLDSYDTNSAEATREVRDLADKFLIIISAGRIEMHNLLCTLAKEVSLSASIDDSFEKTRLWNHKATVDALINKKGTKSVRGIFLDMSRIPKGIALHPKAMIKMQNLRYLKIFDSGCPRQCNNDCKVNLPDGLDLPLKEIRYLYWLRFPLKELPSDFIPENLIDLRLSYSMIEKVWSGIKDTPKLKWVDLSHSTKLNDLSALKNAESLRRLNLEGCTKLVELTGDMENMKNLTFLNFRGCTSLLALPEMKNLKSLKTLILSDCSNFHEFQVVSRNLEYLHLDGTAIKGLPPSLKKLGRLIVLNLKNCKKLESLPDCLDKLKALEELILSGCLKLRCFPHIQETMESLQILLLDGTSIGELPNVLFHSGINSIDKVAIQLQQPRLNGLSMLRRLCLSKNNMIINLQSSISQLYHLKWIDLKYCKNLTSLSTLPPNLNCLDAHACTSLKTVASPLADFLSSTEQASSSFIFTNCENLEHVAKNEILCYAHNKSRLISDALNRQNKGLSFEALVGTCFPGNEVPTWFNHKASGAVLNPELPGHWSESGFIGIALCVVLSFQDYKIQNNNLTVKCECEFNNGSSSVFKCNVGGLPEAGDEQRTINSTHVFVGFTSWLNIERCQEVVGLKKGCIPTKASIKFEVTDDTCEVLKCGFSLVCESDNGSWGANVDASPVTYESDDEVNPIPAEARQGGSRFLGLLRRRVWFLSQ